ncbi:hypothetical protein PK35_05090 [Tamlana nanhaiensis]|uniref:Sulfotransferase n=1 Tax=Neotamlana nanhaiensis TaxID=1382798 RepID=A0A0D7W8F8_9FLAO|nr:sulfotransferase [Tamlana nanhaiensis]KJD34107.1 hypothetical protein PK35_05090 [Tamlana nanhaiensis]
MKSPIFIFSLPRSGSTLLQRLLMAHKSISSVSEPWILLPYIYSTKQHGVISEYSSINSYTGVSDFINNLPNSEKDYKGALRNFVLELYEKQCRKNEVYFLDKTPRYYLVINEIVELFPDAKFIFLFRNPVQVYASIINTFADNKLQYFNTQEDVIDGMELLSEGYNRHKQNAIFVNYESLTENSEVELSKIFEYLELTPDFDVLSNFSSQNTKGRFGDPTGVKEYNQISSKSIDKWKKTFNNPVRKRHLLKTINSISSETLNIQGYNKAQLLTEIKSIKVNLKGIVLDFKDLIFSYLVRRFKLNLFFAKTLKWTNKKFLN